MASYFSYRLTIGLFSLALLALFPTLVVGQQNQDSLTTSFKKNHFGFSTGLGFSGVRDRDYFNMGKMLGSPNASFVYQRNLLPQFGIRTGIGYVRKGDIYNFYANYPYVSASTKIILNYVEVPLLFTLQVPDEGRVVCPYLNAGVAYGFALGKTMAVSKDPITDQDAYVKNVNKEISNPIDNSIVAGGGFKFNANHTSFFVEIQYSYSTSNVFYYRSHNNVLSMHIGFLFSN